MKNPLARRIFILISALIFGFLVVTQAKSFLGANELLEEDSRTPVFREIKILKSNNDDLRKEIELLEDTLKQLDNQGSALKTIEEEIKDYQKLNGEMPVFGPGIILTISGNINKTAMVDLMNEFFSGGTEALSINGIRITNETRGLNSTPQGQILLNGNILSTPYVFTAIGDGEVLKAALNSTGGVLGQIKEENSGVSIDIVEREVLQIN